MNKILARVGAVVGFTAASVALVAAPSFAAVDPSVGTAVTAGFTDMTGLIVGTLVPALFGLVVIGIAIRLGVKYLKRGASA